MKQIVEYYCELPAIVRKLLWRVWHKLLIDFDKSKTNTFMNYGYAGNNGEYKDFVLQEQDASDLYSILLYDFVTRGFDFNGKNILEVGSGRGGGASYLTRYKKPNTYTALDISHKVIDFCNNFHKIPGLKFIKGDAENLPFPSGSFDALINVESARCYPCIQKFFSETYRVLKPDGKFFFADMIKNNDVGNINNILKQANFEVIEKKDIRENVVKALYNNSESIKTDIDKKIPGFLRNSFYEFAGVIGSNRYNLFANNNMQYWSFILVKK